MNPLEIKQLRAGFWALGHETRLRIVLLLPYEGTQLHAGLIGQLLDLNASTCSKHLRILAQAGLLKEERSGQYVHYKVNLDRLRELQTFLTDRLPSIQKETPNADSSGPAKTEEHQDSSVWA